jgi:hypothetical protein
MTDEQQIKEALAEGRRLDAEFKEVFGMAPTVRYTIRPTGIQFTEGDGRIWWFSCYGWTAEQEQAVAGLFRHFPRRVWGVAAVTRMTDSDAA